MTSRNLEFLFKPRSIALIGASDRAHSVGATVMRNLLEGGFAGPIWPVNIRHSIVAGRCAYPTVKDLPAAPDLAVICTPAATVPGLIGELGARGTRAAIVLSAGLEQAADESDRDAEGERACTRETIADAMLKAARPYTLRILGPNCIGLLVPRLGLNASFAHVGASAGNLAFVAQSGALTTAMLDWAQQADVGFSHFISLGSAADVDFGDLLDYLRRDTDTGAILLYAESITSARKFMSAARAAARVKPVLVVKSGRTAASAQAALSHSGALAGSDAVYDAAFRRAGILRVESLRDLFDAAEILARWRTYAGPRLAVVTNGGGPAVLAADALVRHGGKLASFASDTHLKLDKIIPSRGSHANPLDIGGDARPERYLAALEAVSADPGVDAVLLMHAPTAVTSVAEVSAACTPALAHLSRPGIACWLGTGGEGEESRPRGVRRRRAQRRDECSSEPGARPPRDVFLVPTYSTPEEAVDGFLHVVRYQESQALLLEVPIRIAEAGRSDLQVARTIIARALAEDRFTLTEPESKEVLAAYGIAVVETRVVRDAANLASAATSIGYPVALKILSPDVSHKSDVGGVALNLGNAEELQRAAYAMLLRCRELKPAARIEGFTVQKMVRRGGAHELFAGITVDPTFGPAIVFGQGGTAVEVIADRALALPPLNERLAYDLIGQTRISRLLGGFRDQPAVNLVSLERALVSLAQLAADVPEIIELDVNPLLTDEHGALALDARIRIARSRTSAADRFAIRPYPAELEERTEFRGRPLILRPIRPEDFEQHKRFLAHVSAEDLRSRFFVALREVPDRDLAQLTQIDYDREMAFIAVASGEDGRDETFGVARACADPDNIEAEFAVLVRSDLKGAGLGRMLLEKLVRYCRERGTSRMTGEVLSDNVRMTALATAFGFRTTSKDRGLLALELDLKSTALQSSPTTGPLTDAQRSTPEPA